MENINKIKGTIDLYNKKYIIVKKIINTIRNELKLYGYTPIKTPSIENSKILLKTDNKIIYYIYNGKKKYKKFLIFDLTIPLIRFLLNNYNKIIFPFKKYQIQKVWRGENTQYNRYREFYQFDVDIVTFKKDYRYIIELELITLCEKIFKSFKINVTLLINDKNILYGLCKIFKIKKNKWDKFLIIIDKIKKINIKKIINILIKQNFILKKYIKKLIKLYNIDIYYDNEKKINILKKIFKKTSIGIKGVKNLLKLFNHIKIMKLKYINLKINFFLSRGFNYYNSIIFEIISNKDSLSILGGGRYDNYIKINNRNTYYIGMSFGIYRIYNILKNNINFIKEKDSIKVLFVNLNQDYNIYIYYRNKLNNYKIINEIYPYYDKITKQIKYAIKKNINFLIFLGKKELKNKIIKLKKINTHKEYIFKNINKLIIFLKKNYK
ncbi:MAG: ATP phosphoribosyltransferase regulatory subunit [Candidatus Shikimatogenerans bostrichidophilus]|nr:MAG: ATP phosphoribosyltransferase regulatory subunit [Candidatus Shikimatogenerans bostrichidophilus]